MKYLWILVAFILGFSTGKSFYMKTTEKEVAELTKVKLLLEIEKLNELE